MKMYTLEQLLSTIIFSLKFSGIHITKSSNKRNNCKLLLLHFPLFISCIFFVRTSMLTNDLNIFGKTVIYGLGGLVQTLLKLVWFTGNMDSITQLLRMVIIDASKEHQKLYKSPIENGLLRKYSKAAQMLALCFLAHYIITFFVEFVCPYVYSLFTEQWINPLGYKIEGISDVSRPGYDIHLLTQQYVVFHIMNIIGHVDILFYCFVIFIAFKCDVCRYQIQELGQIPGETSQTLRKVVEAHVAVIKFLSIFQSVFQPVLLQQIAIYSIVIVFCLQNIDNSAAFGNTMLIALCQIFITCVFGELIKYKTHQACVAFNYCDWLTLTRSDRKNYLILLINSHRNRNFKLLCRYELSLKTFIKIVKLIFSYYMFLDEEL